jgi:hypothetical protein
MTMADAAPPYQEIWLSSIEILELKNTYPVTNSRGTVFAALE